MTEAQFRQHWIGKVFRAETPSGPKIVASLVDEDDWWNKMLGRNKAA